MNQTVPRLSMITFFYNEEKDMERYLDTVTRKFEILAGRHAFDYEIVMVDDGSRDASRDIVDDFVHRHPGVPLRLVAYQPNRGIGHALVTGLARCRHDYVFWNDVDLHFDLLDMDKILPHLDPGTIVSAYKTNLRSKRSIPWTVSRTNYWLLKLAFLPRIKDFQFVQFYPRGFLDRVRIVSRSSLIPCELLTRAHRMGYRIHQVPLTYYSPNNGRQSKCTNLHNIRLTLRDIVKLKRELLS